MPEQNQGSVSKAEMVRRVHCQTALSLSLANFRQSLLCPRDLGDVLTSLSLGFFHLSNGNNIGYDAWEARRGRLVLGKCESPSSRPQDTQSLP